MRHVASIRGLENLSIRETFITDAGVAHLAACNFKYANAGQTRIGDRGLAVLAAMPAMQQLQLRGCREITDAGILSLARMQNLWMLNISGCPGVTDASISVLANIQSLLFIQVFDSGITQAGAQDYRSRRPDADFDH